MRFSIVPFVAALSLLGTSCYGALPQVGSDTDDPVPKTLSPELGALSSTGLFQHAAEKYDVPVDLLLALSWHETSFAPLDDDHPEHRPARGWMGLTPERVRWGVELTGLSEEIIREDRAANVLAGAAILAEMRDGWAASTTSGTVDAGWWPAVVEWADFDVEWLAHDFAKDVFQTLQRGLEVETTDGDLVRIAAREIPGLQDVFFVRSPESGSGSFSTSTDYPAASRFMAAHSSNFSSRSGGTGAIRRVVIHTTEGSYDGAISWFRNASANVSAHYVLRKSDGEVTQMVPDANKAWHVCGSNNDTIGLEHEGASSNPATWTAAMLDASARLTAWLVREYDIPIDRDHIVGHGEIQGAGCAYRYDPGPHFPWSDYMAAVQGYATGSSADSMPPSEGAPPDLDPGGSADGGGSGIDLSPPSPFDASISFQAPHNGDVVSVPVLMRIVSSGAHHVDVWMGPYRLAHGMTANPVHVAWPGESPGPRTFTARAISAAGSVLAVSSITVEVRRPEVTVEPSVIPLGGMTWRMGASVGGAAEYVKYWVDGWLLTDVLSGSNRASGPGYPLQYSFSYAGSGRLLQARAYDSAGGLLGEGFKYIDTLPPEGVSGAIIDAEAQEAGGTVMRLSTRAQTSVAWVEYFVDGSMVSDLVSGETRASPDEFGLWVEFEQWGPRTLTVRAYNAAGQLIDTAERTIHVPAPELDMEWTRLGSRTYRFDADAIAGTDEIVIETADGEVLLDRTTGHGYAEAPYFVLEHEFDAEGEVWITVWAIDWVGNVLDYWEDMLEVY